jgi:hypothetical protein
MVSVASILAMVVRDGTRDLCQDWIAPCACDGQYRQFRPGLKCTIDCTLITSLILTRSTFSLLRRLTPRVKLPRGLRWSSPVQFIARRPTVTVQVRPTVPIRPIPLLVREFPRSHSVCYRDILQFSSEEKCGRAACLEHTATLQYLL